MRSIKRAAKASPRKAARVSDRLGRFSCALPYEVIDIINSAAAQLSISKVTVVERAIRYWGLHKPDDRPTRPAA